MKSLFIACTFLLFLQSIPVNAETLATPSAPSAAIQNGNEIVLTWSSVSGANYYYRQVSVNGGAWSYSTQHFTTSVTLIFP